MSRTVYVDFKTVKAAVSMSQIIDHYGLTERFRRSGYSLSGPCPLHDGQNPTQFRVSLTKNCWNCFGKCNGGGNVLDFVSRKESVTIREAALMLIGWFNLPMDSRADQPVTETAQPARPEVPAELMTKAAKAAAVQTGPNKPLGFELKNLDQGHSYFGERNISAEAIAHFGLGVCTKGSMNGRVVVPIHNRGGELVAYAGRWPGAPPADTPKYKLPPGFWKAQELFNLHRALPESNDQPLVIVEGFFDCIALWQHGIRRVVALMGSSLSDAQEQLISDALSKNDRLIVMLDEDDAGRAGRQEIVRRLSDKAFVKVWRFETEGQQPDGLTGSATIF